MEESDFLRISEQNLDKLFESICRGSPEYDDHDYEDEVDMSSQKTITQSQIDAAKAEFLARGGEIKKINNI